MFMKKVYNGFDTASEIEPTAWREVLRIINEGTVEGLSQAPVPPTHDELFYRELRHSNEIFAAFKVHTMGNEMAAKLYDANGKLKPFDKWARDVSSIASHQVGSWLQTEYDTAVIRAHAAADWKEFERNRDIMPNLRWMPTTSPEPESSHRQYWQMGLTLPIDDPFWNDHHPGDRWNCKCSLEATDEPVNRPDDMEPTKPQRGLENNPGKDGHTFNDSHPYFPESCSKCPVRGASGFTNKLKGIFVNQKKNCYNCDYAKYMIPNKEGFRVKNKYPNGGRLEIHELVETTKPDYHAIVNIAQHFAKQGCIAQVTPRVHFKSEEYRRIYGSLVGTKYERKCPDLSINGKLYEYEGFVKPWTKDKVGRMLSHGMGQSPRIIINNTKGCGDRYIRKMIKARCNVNGQIDEVWLYEKGNVRLFYKEGKFYKNNREA